MQSLVEIGPAVLEKIFFFISSVLFCYFVIIYPWKRAGPFIWTNLNSIHPRMFCAKFGWNWPSGSGEKDEHVKSLRQQRQRWRQTTDRWDKNGMHKYVILQYSNINSHNRQWTPNVKFNPPDSYFGCYFYSFR